MGRRWKVLENGRNTFGRGLVQLESAVPWIEQVADLCAAGHG